MSLEIHVFGSEEFAARMRRASSNLMPALRSTMATALTRVADYVRAAKLSGDPLRRRSGTLSQAVTGKAEISGTTVIGSLGVAGVPYAKVHEHGGTFQVAAHMRRVAYDARENRIRALTKRGNLRAAVKSMTRGQVRAHSATYPQRAFLRPSLEENRDAITDALRHTVIEAVRDAT
jgi:phage gpG-like protein